MASPVEQFKLKSLVPFELGGVDLSYTTSSLWMTITLVCVTAFLTLSMRGGRLVPGRWQSMAEMSYEFIANMIRENVGAEGRKYFPFIFTLFMFILVGNLVGMIPFAYTFTSQIIVTFAMAATIFIGVTVIGLVRHGLHCKYDGRTHHDEGFWWIHSVAWCVGSCANYSVGGAYRI